MDVAVVSNDTRGWIMCIVSGIACIVGACVICLDLVVRYIPGKQDFRIQDSNSFLACSLSLSFGVMLFSALHSMLPESKTYFRKDKYNATDAGLFMMGSFVAGFIGIQAVSRLIHRIMPSHVVDCDHTHSHDEPDEGHAKHRHHVRSRSRQLATVDGAKTRLPSQGRKTIAITKPRAMDGHAQLTRDSHASESTPLLLAAGEQGPTEHKTNPHPQQKELPGAGPKLPSHRRSLMDMRDRVMSFVKDTPNDNCDADGPCFGYSDPCEQECFEHLSSRSAVSRSNSRSSRNNTTFQATIPQCNRLSEEDNLIDSGEIACPMNPASRRATKAQPHGPVLDDCEQRQSEHHQSQSRQPHDEYNEDGHPYAHRSEAANIDVEAQDSAHHHHVPNNGFLSIGLQTVIAIALHKFPEGFITYASNHANPEFGFNVFMALFVHNIAEGFAMALPLYLALGSRVRAIAWSSVLGGLSQPLGAAIAWLTFKLSGSGEGLGINNTVYAILFAATAGIMTNVALQLFVESLSLDHNRHLSIAFAFLGMVLLGVSNIVAGHHH